MSSIKKLLQISIVLLIVYAIIGCLTLGPTPGQTITVTGTAVYGRGNTEVLIRMDDGSNKAYRVALDEYYVRVFNLLNNKVVTVEIKLTEKLNVNVFKAELLKLDDESHGQGIPYIPEDIKKKRKF